MSLAPVEGAFCATHDEAQATIVCSRCGSYACAACTFYPGPRRPVCHACAEGGLEQLVPWERRQELGWMRAFWQTTKLVMWSPTRFFRTPPSDTGFGSSLLFGALAVTVAHIGVALLVGIALVGSGVFLAFAGSNAARDAGEMTTAGASMACMGLGYAFIMVIQAPIYGLIVSLIAASIEHLGLIFFKSRQASFEDTWRASSYANAAYILWWIPMCGSMLTPFWVAANEVVALRETHRAKNDRVAIVVIGWRVLFVLGIAALYALILAATILGAKQ